MNFGGGHAEALFSLSRFPLIHVSCVLPVGVQLPAGVEWIGFLGIMVLPDNGSASHRQHSQTCWHPNRTTISALRRPPARYTTSAFISAAARADPGCRPALGRSGR